jgi:hypothetical protein
MKMRIAAVAILGAWALFCSLSPLHGLFWLTPGYFGVTTDSSMAVTEVDPGSGAEWAGLRVGDRLSDATSFEDRLYTQYVRNPKPGQVLTVLVERNGTARVVKIVARSQGPYEVPVIAQYFGASIIDLIFGVVASALLLLRPSKMTWAFFIYCIATAPGIVLGHYWLPAWLVFGLGIFAGILQALAFAALLVFCVRVPNDRATGGWRYLAWIGAPFAFMSVLLCNAVVDLSIAGVLHLEVVAGRIQTGVLDATYAAGLLAMIATFSRERGADRSRVAWIIAGFAIGFGARVAANLTDPGANIYTGDDLPDGSADWLLFIPSLQLAIPLAVSYAVVRHRAFNAGFIANRTLVYGLFLCMGFAAFGLLDLLATKRFANNQFEVGMDVALALVIGLSFQFLHPRAIRLIDRIFLPDRYQAAVALERLRTALEFIGKEADGPNRAIEIVVKELKLSSLAIFKKLPDGGFVRCASAGWPQGAAWHIFRGDPLVESFGARTRVRALDESNLAQLGVLPEPNRPRVGIYFSPQTADEGLILVGAHSNGRRPDQDEARGIASLLREFVKPGIEIGERPSFLAVRRDPA